jgi:hypothetical protein
MEQTTKHFTPSRVTDLVALKQGGSRVSCRTSFEILPVDFHHRDNPFQAYIFLCRYTGTVDNNEFAFRKCYARGCPHNLCPHVSQAVMIANRYLQRDYHKLKQAGIHLEKHLFRLEEMTVKFEGYQEEHGPTLAIHDYIHIAEEGNHVTVSVNLEFVPGAEHFANYENQMIFLMVDFAVTCLEKKHHYERCLACYPMENEALEKNEKIAIADERLKLLYDEFDAVSIRHEKRFFGQVTSAATMPKA